MSNSVFTLGLDIDNVLNNCAEWFIDRIDECFGTVIDVGTKAQYMFGEHIPIAQEAQILNTAHEFFEQMLPHSLAVHFLQHLHSVANAVEQQVRFIYITDRRFTGFSRSDLIDLPHRQVTYDLTERWLLNSGFPVTKLFLEGDNGFTKGQIAAAECIDVFIEDAPRKACDLATHMSKSVLSYNHEPIWLMVKPWNRLAFVSDFGVEVLPDNLRFVKDWSEVASLLVRILKENKILSIAQINALEAYKKTFF